MKRNKLGQFLKGTHWRKEKPYWNSGWLNVEYITNFRSAVDIAKQFGVTEAAILFWLRKHNIPRREMKDIRAKKHWGLSGSKNGMFGKIGKLNPRWKGGHSPERQSQYARSAWKELAKSILKRDSYKCKKCYAIHTSKHKLVVHHKKHWSCYPELRFEPTNLITLCERCHKLEHKKY